MKLRERFKIWNYWRKRTINGKFYQFCVLIGLAHSPSFEAEYDFRHIPAPLFRKM